MYWEEEYIHILTERNLVDVLSLLASTEAIDEISALVDTPTWYACCCLDAEKNGPEGVLEQRLDMRLDARKQHLLLYTRRRKKHARSSLRRSTMDAPRRH